MKKFLPHPSLLRRRLFNFFLGNGFPVSQFTIGELRHEWKQRNPEEGKRRFAFGG